MSKIAVLSGGTATNDLTDLFNNLSESVSYILPILDNGGSTSEMIRVLGGPAIGDIRARLTKLIPEDQHSIKQLLSYKKSLITQVRNKIRSSHNKPTATRGQGSLKI